MKKNFLGLGITLALASLACGSDSTDSKNPPSGGLPPAIPPPAVDSTVTEGVFVSASTGDDNADASPGHPVKTLTAAIVLAKARGLAVIACAETYGEAVRLDDGVAIYGYFDCKGGAFKRVEGSHAVIEAKTSPAVLAENLTLPVRFEGFEVHGPDMTEAAAPGASAASSYAMMIRHSKNIALADVILRAGTGQNGSDGVNPPTNNGEAGGGTAAEDSGAQGKCGAPSPFETDPCSAFAHRGTGGAGGTSQCRVGPNGNSGGKGGDGAYINNNNWEEFVAETSGGARPATSQTAEGAAGDSENGVFYNLIGANGIAGSPGARGENGKSSFTAAGFVPGDGTSGKNGSPGQGGGGGAGSNNWYTTGYAGTNPPSSARYHTVTGAGGGAGGCGGLAGSGGKGGGASIGLFVVDSEKISFSAGRIETKAGGGGGRGATGFGGAAGGKGGLGERAGGFYGTAGGNGGPGGAAGLSGHGEPGPSIAFVFSGERPTTGDVTLAPGPGGTPASPTAQGSQVQPSPPAGISAQEQSF